MSNKELAAPFPLLCRAWGETDLPAAYIAYDPDDLTHFICSEWLGDPSDPRVKDVLNELMTFPWGTSDITGDDTKVEWEFEIGGVSFERVYETAPRAALAAQPVATGGHEVCALICEQKAALLLSGKRTNQVDRHTAEVLMRAAEEMRAAAPSPEARQHHEQQPDGTVTAVDPAEASKPCIACGKTDGHEASCARQRWMPEASKPVQAEAPSDEELTAIYKRANGEDIGKAQPLTTARIFKAMRAMLAAHPEQALQAGGREALTLSDEDVTEGAERHGITVAGPRLDDFQAGVRWAELVIANPPDAPPVQQADAPSGAGEREAHIAELERHNKALVERRQYDVADIKRYCSMVVTLEPALVHAANRLERLAINHPPGTSEYLEILGWVDEARAALSAQPQTGLPDYYISGPYTVGKWAGWHSVCETATARVVHHFKPDQPQEVQKPVGIPLNADGHPQVAPTIEAMDALALKAGIPPYSHLQKVLDRKKSQREQVAYLSWGGFNLTGDHKSIDEAKRLLHEASIVPELRELLARALAPQPEQVAQKPVGVVESAAAGAGGFHCRLTGSMPRVGDAVYTTAQSEQVAQDREDAELFAWYVGDARTESNELAKLELRRINGETASLDEYRDAIRAARASGKGGGKP